MKAGAKRVSADAAETFSDVLTNISLKISTKAAEFAKHAGRKTVHEGDVKLAAKQENNLNHCFFYQINGPVAKSGSWHLCLAGEYRVPLAWETVKKHSP